MPNSYDFVTFGETWSYNVVLNKLSKGSIQIGGGARSWNGNKSRPRPKSLNPTACVSTSVQYFDDRIYRGTPLLRQYKGAHTLDGQIVIDSKDDPSTAALTGLDAESRFGKGHMSLLVTLGEGRETASYIANRVSTLAQALNLIRKGRFSDAAKQLGSDLSQNATKRLKRNSNQYRNPADLLSNSWLEYQMGIKPIVNDVYGAVDAYHAKLQAGQRIYASSKRRNGENGSVYRAGISGTVYSKELRTLQQLGLTNIAGAAWDLIPLSFIVNWFIPVDQYFSMLSNTIGVNQVSRWSSKETFQEVRSNKPSNLLWKKSSWYYRSVGSTGWLSGIPLRNDQSSGKLTTATALLQRTIR